MATRKRGAPPGQRRPNKLPTRLPSTAEMLFNEIERETAPNRMSKQEALAVLEEVQTFLDGSIEALREEIKHEGKGC